MISIHRGPNDLKEETHHTGCNPCSGCGWRRLLFQICKGQGCPVRRIGKSCKIDLTQSVSANGEIKPKKSVNISSNAMGRIVSMPVHEGDHVKEGDLLVRLESIQTEADVKSAEAMLDAAQSETEGMAAQLRAAEAGVNTCQAEITRADTTLPGRTESGSRDATSQRRIALERAVRKIQIRLRLYGDLV
jgi:multidrug efflux pump subunit AcrA (membrane-fusion protein)